MYCIFFYKTIMNSQVYLSLLILYGIFFQGISALEENGNSEENHVRKKRLIESEPISLRDARYVVNILENGVRNCVASLLSQSIAITATHCFFNQEIRRFSMLSGSVRPDSGIHHNITDIIPHPGFDPPQDLHDLCLITFFPHITAYSRNRQIKLYSGVLSPNSLGSVSSWGCHAIIGGRIQLPNQLRSIKMTIISLDECRRRYKHTRYSITNHFICAFGNGAKRCEFGDSGAPLVVNGQLVGVMSWNLIYNEHNPVPDVFMNLLNDDYRAWISQYVPRALEHN